MTINEMLEQGIVLQGSIEIRQYDADIDGYETVFDDVVDDGLMYHVDEPWADCSVGYIYCAYGRNGMTIEVGEE